MNLNRRQFIAGMSAAPFMLAMQAPASAAPILSESNFNLTYEKVKRGNGWIEIDAEQFVRNLRELRRIVGSQSSICAVIKADCYGHGASLLVPFLIKEGVTRIGFASNEEARVARALGYRGELIRIRTATSEEVEDGLPFEIVEVVGNRDDATVLSEMVAAKGRKLNIHLFLNSTGMCRNGLDISTAEGKADAILIAGLKNVRIHGLMSHFPVEEVEDMQTGLAQFHLDVDWLIDHTGLKRNELTLHIANSYATLNLPSAHLDMVRVGGALLGDTDPNFAQFKRIMTFKSRAVAINAYPAGKTVSYDRTFELARDSWLVNIPLGYSDGYRRSFSRKNRPQPDSAVSYVLINGHRAPVVGRITMNTFMADVTDIKDLVRLGDEVVLYGRQGNEEITPAELETISQTIAVDFYTEWGNLMPKILKPRTLT